MTTAHPHHPAPHMPRLRPSVIHLDGRGNLWLDFSPLARIAIGVAVGFAAVLMVVA